MDDLETEDFINSASNAAETTLEYLIITAAYPAAAAREHEEESKEHPIDKVENPEDFAKTDVTRLAEKED